MNLYNTVSAISTPPGKGGVALIRTSGKDAVKIVEQCFLPKSGKRLSEIPSRTVVYGDILRDGEKIDDGTAVIFRAPHSYTGEDTVEITCHGGAFLTRSVLEGLFLAGATPASRGEFTRRAFLSGKLSLTDAEAIGTLLDAKNFAQVRLSSKEGRSRLSGAISEIHDALLTEVSSMYAKIDFPDEDLAEYTAEEICEHLSLLLEKTDALLKTYSIGHAVSEGIRTVIVGRPNVGKSSLYNRLCGEEYAIVTDIEGTTRDILEHTVTVGQVMLLLCDTAGLHDTQNPIEKIGIDRARLKMEEAELILAVFDGSRPLSKEDFDLLAQLKQSKTPSILLLNKSDIGILEENKAHLEDFPYVLSFSTRGGDLGALTKQIEELFFDGDISLTDTAIVTSARQFAALSHAREGLLASLSGLRAGLPFDVCSSDLEIALGALSELDGRAVSEEIVSGIFSKFCVGK